MKNITFIIAALFTITTNVKAQAPEWEWAKAGESANDSRPYGIVTDDQDNVYMTGYFIGPSITFQDQIVEHPGTYPQAKFYLVKYNAEGNLIWLKSIGQDYLAMIGSIAIDSEGFILLTGNYKENISFDDVILSDNTGEIGTFIAKFNSDGDIIWAKDIDGETNVDAYTRPMNISTDSNNNIYITGNFKNQEVDFGNDVILQLEGDQCLYIVKYNSDGDAQWASKIVSTNALNTIMRGELAIDSQQNVFLTGSFASGTLTIDETILTSEDSEGDVFLIKYNQSGTLQFADKYSGEGHDVHNDIAIDNEGYIYLSGHFFSQSIQFNDLSVSNANTIFSDVFLVKFSNDGTPVWAKTITGSFAEEGTRLGIENNRLYVSGLYSSNDMTFDGNIFEDNIPLTDFSSFIAKYSLDGNFEWVKQVEDINAMFEFLSVKNNNIYLAGNYTSDIQLGDSILSSEDPEIKKVFVTKLYDPTMDNEEFVKTSIAVYPNPASNILNVPLNEGELYSIVDISGRIIMAGSLKNNSINVSSLRNGMYMLQINRSFTKFIKE